MRRPWYGSRVARMRRHARPRATRSPSGRLAAGPPAIRAPRPGESRNPDESCWTSEEPKHWPTYGRLEKTHAGPGFGIHLTNRNRRATRAASIRGCLTSRNQQATLFAREIERSRARGCRERVELKAARRRLDMQVFHRKALIGGVVLLTALV